MNDNAMPSVLPAGTISRTLNQSEIQGFLSKSIPVPEGLQAVVIRDQAVEQVIGTPGRHEVQGFWEGLLNRNPKHVVLMTKHPFLCKWPTKIYQSKFGGWFFAEVTGIARITDPGKFLAWLGPKPMLTPEDLVQRSLPQVDEAVRRTMQLVEKSADINDASLIDRMKHEISDRLNPQGIGVALAGDALSVILVDPVRQKVNQRVNEEELQSELDRLEKQYQLFQSRREAEYADDMDEIRLGSERARAVSDAERLAMQVERTKRTEEAKAELLRHGNELVRKGLVDQDDVDALTGEIAAKKEERQIRANFRLDQLRRKARERSAFADHQFKVAELQGELELKREKLDGDISLDEKQREHLRKQAQADFASKLEREKREFDEQIRRVQLSDLADLERETAEARLAVQVRRDQLTHLEAIKELERVEAENAQRLELEKKREQQRLQLELMAQTVNMPLEQLLITFQGEVGQNLLKMRLLDLASKSEDPGKILALNSAIQPEAFKVFGEMYSAKHQAELREVERRNYEERLKEQAAANQSLESRNQRLEDNLQAGQERTAELLTEALRTNRDMGVAAVSQAGAGSTADSSAAGARTCPFCFVKSVNVKMCACGYTFP